ncbi:MAG: AMP-binding protein [Desulfobacterium sp.]|jgi:long-chain acyl-CoA synthetase|nr:AMP-binding protein [Desulfobacterium sp.]
MNPALEKNLIQRVAVGDIFRRRAANTPDVVALRDYKGLGIKQLTFLELNRAMNQFASSARQHGLKKGDSVALLGLNSAEYVIALYGCAKAGLIAVPINPGIAPQDVVYVINHSEAVAVVTDSLLVPFVDKVAANLPNIKTMICIPTGEEEVSSDYILFAGFLTNGDDRELTDVIIEDRDIFEILYTSGTTGKPKGVLISHLGVFISSLSAAIQCGLKPGFSSTMMLPIFHCAQQAVTLSTLHVGGTVVVIRQFEPGMVMDIVEKDEVNFIFALPIMYRAMVNHPAVHDHNWENLKSCMFAMAPMDQSTLKSCIDVFKADFMLGTGQTECYPPTNIFHASQHPDKQGNYWGKSCLVLDTAVMDERGNLLGPDEVGEIVWRGPVVMEGYFKDDEATAVSREFGWHHSGDLGSFDEDGQLLFVDRKKDMIKTGGENVASIKVERAILSNSRVDQVAVVGLPDDRWIEAVTAFVVPVKDSGLTPEDVIANCSSKLGKFEVPKRVILVEKLPVTSTGKVRKNILREEYSDLEKT